MARFEGRSLFHTFVQTAAAPSAVDAKVGECFAKHAGCLLRPFEFFTPPGQYVTIHHSQRRRWMSLGNGTRSVPPSHIEIVDVA
ncbi:hypothetical protein TNCV_2484231 [Trichonephila clavipes]|uniref:Uncharacterized protein n=1 Tax=Trichonephila clavipes TaxID=2585209 RepID=A0A8X6VZE3_TRICX|nr:hypothetical protein TNCV_2484231 [Trichonephila clavipes]